VIVEEFIMKVFTFVDVCLPDYFQGCSGVCYAVPVDSEMTVSESRDVLYEEWINSFNEDGIETEDNFNLAFDHLIDGVDGDAKLFPDVGDCCYAYFTVEEYYED
jgi:hypothetical protein